LLSGQECLFSDPNVGVFVSEKGEKAEQCQQKLKVGCVADSRQNCCRSLEHIASLSSTLSCMQFGAQVFSNSSHLDLIASCNLTSALVYNG
jgi:hypothetical protein